MKIGFIGLGIMGESMSKRIIDLHDDDVYVYDLDESKVDKLVSQGGIAAENNKDLAKKSDMIFSMVPKSEHSEALYEEIKDELNEDKIWVDMSTISPIVSQEIAKQVQAKGARFADAPVVKSKPAAISGDLGIYVGSTEELHEVIRPILAYMGSNIIRMGSNGSGLVMKICHNALVSQIQNGVNETLKLALNSDIDIDDFVTAISYGGGQNFYLDSKSQVIKNQDYTTAFSIENMNKDLTICLDLADAKNIKLPGIKNAKSVYSRAMEAGYGKDDFSKTFEVVKED